MATALYPVPLVALYVIVQESWSKTAPGMLLQMSAHSEPTAHLHLMISLSGSVTGMAMV